MVNPGTLTKFLKNHLIFFENFIFAKTNVKYITFQSCSSNILFLSNWIACFKKNKAQSFVWKELKICCQNQQLILERGRGQPLTLPPPPNSPPPQLAPQGCGFLTAHPEGLIFGTNLRHPNFADRAETP